MGEEKMQAIGIFFAKGIFTVFALGRFHRRIKADKLYGVLYEFFK